MFWSDGTPFVVAFSKGCHTDHSLFIFRLLFDIDFFYFVQRILSFDSKLLDIGKRLLQFSVSCCDVATHGLMDFIGNWLIGDTIKLKASSLL